MKLNYKPDRAPRLILVPFLDMFTTILIFLIVCFSPQESKIKKTTSMQLPASKARFLEQLSKVQVEVTGSQVKVNGKAIDGLTPTAGDAAAWQKFKTLVIEAYGDKEVLADKGKQPIILMADKNAEFGLVDNVVAHLANIGFGAVYFLTETRSSKTANAKPTKEAL